MKSVVMAVVNNNNNNESIRNLIDLGSKLNRFLVADITFLEKVLPQFSQQLGLFKAVFKTQHLRFNKFMGQIAQVARSSCNQVWTQLRTKEEAFTIVNTMVKPFGVDLNVLGIVIPEKTRAEIWPRFHKYIVLLDSVEVTATPLNPDQMYAELMSVITTCLDPMVFAKMLTSFTQTKAAITKELETKDLTKDMNLPPEVAHIVKNTITKTSATLESQFTWDNYTKILETVKDAVNTAAH